MSLVFYACSLVVKKKWGLVSAEMDEVLEVIVRQYRFFYKIKDEAVWIIAV
jgi:hypothetical protein